MRRKKKFLMNTQVLENIHHLEKVKMLATRNASRFKTWQVVSTTQRAIKDTKK